MESLNIKINYKMNPADFYMLEVSELKKSEGYLTPMTSVNWQRYMDIKIKKG